MPKNKLFQFIKQDLSGFQGHFVNVLKASFSKIDKTLKSDPWIVSSWLSVGDGALFAERDAIRSFWMAFFHYKEMQERNPKLSERDYIIVSNMFESINDVKNVIKHSINEFNSTPSLEEVSHFLETKVLLLNFGTTPLSNESFFGLFHPENNAIFTQTAGYASLGECISVGNIPIIRPRKYHSSFIDSLETRMIDLLKKYYGDKTIKKLRDFFNLSKSSDLNIVKDFTHLYLDLNPMLKEVAVMLKSDHNISDYVADVVEAFYNSKPAAPKNLMLKVLEGTAFDPNNHFFKAITDRSSSRNYGYRKCMEILNRDQPSL